MNKRERSDGRREGKAMSIGIGDRSTIRQFVVGVVSSLSSPEAEGAFTAWKRGKIGRCLDPWRRLTFIFISQARLFVPSSSPSPVVSGTPHAFQNDCTHCWSSSVYLKQSRGTHLSSSTSRKSITPVLSLLRPILGIWLVSADLIGCQACPGTSLVAWEISVVLCLSCRAAYLLEELEG